MKKKLILAGIVVGAGLISFALTFTAAMLTTEPEPLPEPEAAARKTESAKSANATSEVSITQSEILAESGNVDDDLKKEMTRKQLKNLVYEVQETIRIYKSKIEEIQQEETRLQITKDKLNDQISEMKELQTRLSTTAASVKEEREKLQKTVININNVEKDNLITIAATYDKMDSVKASEILEDMSQMQNSVSGSGFDDAIKILHFMKERTRGKLLAELATNNSKLAAIFCQRLKRIRKE